MAANIIINTEIQSIMEERGIRNEDLQEVVKSFHDAPHLHDAEGKRFLAKKRLGNFTVNAEFVLSGDNLEICNVYSYVISLADEQPA